MKKMLGFLFIACALAMLFLSPFIWMFFERTIQDPLNGYGFPILLGILFSVLFFVISGLYFLTSESTTNE